MMDVEITGMPDPEVKWFKDDVPIGHDNPRYRLQRMGNCYQLAIDSSKWGQFE